MILATEIHYKYFGHDEWREIATPLESLEGADIIRTRVLAALERAEPWGVWGGEILDRGSILSFKRPRGRPRKDGVAA